MRRRILVAILSVTAVAIVLFGIPLGIIVARFVDEEATLRVERQAILAAREVPEDFALSTDPVELPINADGIQFALYDLSGALVSGIGPVVADATVMRALGNHVADGDTSDTRVVAVPIAADEQVSGAIRAEQSTAASDARVRRIVGLLGGLAVGVLAIGAGIGYVVAGRLSRPVRRLRDAALQLGDGDFSIEVPGSRVPELDQVAHAMTVTARRLDDLVTRERAFSADASHQLRTPLAGLRAAIETELAFPRSDSAAVLREALADVDRLEQTITELLAIARTSTIIEGSVALADVFAQIEASWQRTFAKGGRTLDVSPARYTPQVNGSPTALRHALDVLLDNALHHGAGEVRVEHVVTDDSVTIIVSDEGEGFTAPATSVEGSDISSSLHGLGLPLARRLIEAMPGRLTITRLAPHPRIEIVLQRA
ncbi:HAMP domain-containing sensor histidine kinase [soil metagenome]